MAKYFFIIGAQRCGTTFLAENLRAHPKIRMASPMRPEPKYFLNDPNSISIRHYRSHFFADAKTTDVCGEKSTTYIERVGAARKIVSLIPDAKFIVVLRDPVERAISNYWFSKKNGFENRTMAEALAPGAEKIVRTDFASASPYDYLKRGIYKNFLDDYANVVDIGDNLSIVQYERLISHPVQTFREIFDYLDIDQNPSFDVTGVLNSASRDMVIDQNLENSLYEYFHDHNLALEMSYRVDLNLWAPKSKK